MKICKKCQVSEQNYKFEHGRAICKICRSNQNADFYQKHKAKICSASKNYRQQNKELIAVRAKDTYQKNRDTILAQKTTYYIKNRDTILSRLEEYYESNKERIKVNKVKYSKNNADKISCRNAKRRATLAQACPKWLCNKHVRRIMAFYRLAQYLTKKTNIPHEVDHIVPLKGEEVRGLHVPWNLQILTRRKNRQKSNKAGKSDA